MTLFPGPRPLRGDSALITLYSSGNGAGRVLAFTGDIVTRGILQDGRGYAELVLPDADPQHRRHLERAARYSYELTRGGRPLYTSPLLAAVSAGHRAEDGALVVTGAPS